MSKCARLVGRSLAGALAIATFNVSQGQAFNCYEGTGVLENGWADWSWSSNNYRSTAYTYQGQYSIQVTFTGGYQAFSLESPTSFPAGYFSALTFWIDGGATAGRSIQVALVANGSTTTALNLNKYISGGAVGAKSWRSVTIPLSAFGVKTSDQISR